MDELVSYIARQDSFSTKDVPPDVTRQIELKLKHVDLPKSAELGIIRYDPTEETVELTNPSLEFEAILSTGKMLERNE